MLYRSTKSFQLKGCELLVCILMPLPGPWFKIRRREETPIESSPVTFYSGGQLWSHVFYSSQEFFRFKRIQSRYSLKKIKIF